MLHAILYYLHNLKNVKNIHGGVLTLLKVTLLHGCFTTFFKLCKWYQIVQQQNKIRKMIHLVTTLLHFDTCLRVHQLRFIRLCQLCLQFISVLKLFKFSTNRKVIHGFANYRRHIQNARICSHLLK